MKKNLYLMRHGETLFNTLKKVQGACDSPLTEKGIQQAKKAHDYFTKNQITFDHAYASTQERACDTLEIVTDQMPYTRLKGLKEMNFGSFEGEHTYLQPKGPKNFETFYVQYGGEAAQSVRERIVATLTEIMNKSDHQNVIAVSHNGVSYYFLKEITKKPEQLPLAFPNCGIFVIEYDDQKGFSLIDIIDPMTEKSILE